MPTVIEQDMIDRMWHSGGGMVRCLMPKKDVATCTRLVRKGYMEFLKYRNEDKRFDSWRLKNAS